MEEEETPVYEPDEDSYLILDALKDELLAWEAANKLVVNATFLDMGAGTGFIGLEMAKRGLQVTLVDVNKAAIIHIKKQLELEEVQADVVHSDLFANLGHETFDIIAFNTPYLPNDGEEQDPALHGGNQGNEVALSFIKELHKHLNDRGVAFLLTSSLASPKEIETALKQYDFSYSVVSQKKLFFEELFVYRIVKKND